MARNSRRPATADEGLAELLAGNRRFVAGTPRRPRQDASYRAKLVTAQHPFAAVLTCSDSRVPSELIFDQGFGDLFVVRVAGHVASPEVVASVEYAVSVLAVPLVVVLGHTACGAVAATRDAVTGASRADPRLQSLVDRITPSVVYAGDRGVTDVDGIVDVHVRRTVTALTTRGGGLPEAVAAGRCVIVGASYRLTDGLVTPVTPVPADAVPGRDRGR